MNYQRLIDLSLTSPQQALAETLERNDLEAFKQVLRYGASVNVRDENAVYSIFESACSTFGKEYFIRACLEYGAHATEINPVTKEYPIHIAASSKDCKNLAALIESRRIVIDQKFEDRTALFMLFEVLSVENYKNVFECIKLLLNEGANINATNEADVSPVHILAVKKESWRKDILEYCLNQCGVNVDYRKGKARELIEKNFPDVTIPYYDMEDITVKVLKSKLLAGSEEVFLANLRKFEKQGKTLLTEDIRDLLSSAVDRSKLEAAKTLVKPKMNNDKLLEASSLLPGLLAKCCNRGNVEVLQWLLSIIPEHELGFINKDALLSLLVKQIDVFKDKSTCPYFKIMKLLLQDGRIDVDKLDSATNRTALHYAVKYKIDHAQELLLAMGANLGVEDMFSDLPVFDMEPSVLEKHLDSCVSFNEVKPGDDGFEMRINLSNFLSSAHKTNYSCDYAMLPILRMAQHSDMKHLLRHPVISSILLLNWFKLSVFFKTNLLICMVFFVSFIAYGLQTTIIHKVSFILSVICLVYLLVREGCQMVLNKLAYLRSFENYMEIAIIIGAGSVLLFNLSEGYRQTISALVIIMIAFEITCLMGTYPPLSTYMVMLKTVSKNFLKWLFVFSIVLIAFTFGFHTLFPKSDSELGEFNKFQKIPLAFLKVGVMLTGELDASEFEFSDINWIVFALFLFFVPMVLYNLINGLAVSDITEIKAESEIISLTERVYVINKHETTLKTIERIGKNFRLFSNTVPHRYIIIKPNISKRIWMPLPVKRGSSDSETESMELKTIRSGATAESESVPMLLRTGEQISAKCVKSNLTIDGNIVKYALNILFRPKGHREE
ncbi:transient receptor potential cation channel protein painless-like [Anopheles darlingi]|uniref:transient receptor potential cation channel protein painless-like n=1 Tax=Anopheles darlingi TaxID=43151 RepID=UPI00210049D1|nr:transient receptor potential cation channel protein painless-like [Anopheles darlingi]